MPAYTLCERPSELTPQLGDADRIGVDTEFMRESTYFSQLCLVQVATGRDIYCVDPLADEDQADFWEALCRPCWVLHSARQDIEVISQTAGRMPAQILDTQIAAALLGFQPQIGYANLVSELFSVDLPKTHTRANWAKRPLPERFLDYAAEDVEYLLPAWEELAGRLEAKGRLEWAEADSRALLDPALYEVEPSTAVLRLKGARNLRGGRRATAARLAEWREREALKRDRPRQWILRDPVLIDIACRMPKALKELADIDNMPARLVQRAGKEILAAVRQAASDAHDYRPPGAPDEQQKSLLKQMQRVVAKAADDLGIAAETIASKKELSAVIVGREPDSRLFRDWRRDLVGNELAALL